MKYLISLLILFQLQAVTSQSKKIYVLDAISQKPIADVLMVSQGENVYSDINGVLNLVNQINDSIELIHYNYLPKFIRYAQTLDTIFMQRKPLELDEIVIKAKKSKRLFDMGYYNTRKRLKQNGSLKQSLIMAVFIPNDSSNAMIDEILLDLKSKQRSESYGVLLYQPDSLGMPGKIIYSRKIVIDSLDKNGIIRVSEINIEVPENGIFIGLETFETNDPERNILDDGIRFSFTENVSKAKSYIILKDRHVNPQNGWYSFEFVFGSDIVPCFGLRVYQMY